MMHCMCAVTDHWGHVTSCHIMSLQPGGGGAGAGGGGGKYRPGLIPLQTSGLAGVEEDDDDDDELDENGRPKRKTWRKNDWRSAVKARTPKAEAAPELPIEEAVEELGWVGGGWTWWDVVECNVFISGVAVLLCCKWLVWR